MILCTYLLSFSLFALSLWSFRSGSWISFAPIVYSFGCIPLFELFLRPNEKNLSTDQEREKAADKFYDRLLYLVVPLHLFMPRCIPVHDMESS